MQLADLSLAFGITFLDLYSREGLVRLHNHFLSHVEAADADLKARFVVARSEPEGAARREHTELLMELAPQIDDFVAILFGIETELRALRARHNALAPIFEVKRNFVQRRAARSIPPQAANTLDASALLDRLALGLRPDHPDFELAFARAVTDWQTDADAHGHQLEAASRYAAWALHSESGRRAHENGVLFRMPRRIDPLHLVPVQATDSPTRGTLELPKSRRKPRDGFRLTDHGADLLRGLDEAHYCIHCHRQEKDSCSTGLRDRHTGKVQTGPLGSLLTGCPLEERISEFQQLKAAGHPVAALAMIMIDNPLVAATGHRICNDCMKACIFQKQEPVDIPQVETRTLKDVLELPWGFEIYSLLSRWNPLNLVRPLPRRTSGYKVLVVGMGPAGFSLAHHLLNDGHSVVAVDGLKIEPLPALAGVQADGTRSAFAPIRDVTALWAPLDERIMAGFGGVAEYGITVRWDKNFLTLVRLLLERRSAFTMIGGVRFGGTLTLDDAFALGFDHVALCTGAGRPTLLPMQNTLARGVRQAADFLMALQLTGAARATSLANLQIRLPIVVIGGGLTAIDAATEALAYYPVQVERFLVRCETLIAEHGETALQAQWSPEEKQIAADFVHHARAIRDERTQAADEGRAPDVQRLLAEWGGATIVYRRALTDSPCYRLNHEEVIHAMDEGIRLIEHVTPQSVETDEFGHAAALHVIGGDAGSTRLEARSVLVAAGSQPNTMLASEDPSYLTLDGRYFAAIDEDGLRVTPERTCKPEQAQVLAGRTPDGRYISFLGDLHPSFGGNVVKAMASGKRGSSVISERMAGRAPTNVSHCTLATSLNRELRPIVRQVTHLTPTITEVLVRAPQAARKFRPGQFFRLQNFETLAPKASGTVLAAEGLALTGASVDANRGLISLIVLKTGGSSDLCDLLRPGEPVVLMGPTGQATELPDKKTLCLVGGGLGNAVLFSIGQAARANGNRVVYFAGYRSVSDRFKPEQIEAAADVVVWSSEEAPGFAATRAGDRSCVGNVVQAMQSYAQGELGAVDISLADVGHLIVIGSDRMMGAVAAARRGRLAPYLAGDHVAIASVNSPMQCMMKEICAQCLQLHRDVHTGAETIVFSCAGQDQRLDSIDFDVLRARLGQNAVAEKLSAAWLRYCLRQLRAG